MGKILFVLMAFAVAGCDKKQVGGEEAVKETVGKKLTAQQDIAWKKLRRIATPDAYYCAAIETQWHIISLPGGWLPVSRIGGPFQPYPIISEKEENKEGAEAERRLMDARQDLVSAKDSNEGVKEAEAAVSKWEAIAAKHPPYRTVPAIEVAAQHAKDAAAKPSVRAAVVLDLYTAERPRAIKWYVDDGKGVKESTKAPTPEMQASLEEFIFQLIVNAGR